MGIWEYGYFSFSHARKNLNFCLLILDTPEHVDSENTKLKIGTQSLLDQLFSKRDLN
jgi:hypothetical protein